MGLEQGGRCDGIAYRIPEEQLSTELDILFRREMLSFIYKPTWITTVNASAANLPRTSWYRHFPVQKVHLVKTVTTFFNWWIISKSLASMTLL